MEVLSYSSPYPEWFIDKSRDKALSEVKQQMWLLAGLHIHPKHCALRLALYQWHLKNSPVPLAAEELSKILKEHPDDEELIRYLTELLALVNSQSNSLEVGVLKCLTLAEQQNVYLTVATSHHDKLACTSTVLQMMRAYPTSIPQHAISAAKVLIKYEQQQGSKLGSINPLRKMLILELMPLILSKGTEFLDTLTETVVTLFVQLVAHYYIECASVTDPAIKEEYKISEPWSDLKENLVKFAKLHNWQILPEFQASNMAVVLGHVEDVIQTAPPSVSSGMFYCLLFLLFECSFKYIKSVDTYSLILVKSSEEKAVLPLDKPAGISAEEEPVRKRRRTLSITESSSNIINAFTVAEKCHNYLSSKMSKQFSNVCDELNAPSWRWYSLFLGDVALFNSHANLSAAQQHHSKQFPADELRIMTQQALGSSGPSNTMKWLWSLLDNLPPHSDTAPQHKPDIFITNSHTGDTFSFLLNNRSKLCLHICRTLVHMVQSRIPKTRQSDILALLLIIYQYDVDMFQGELERTIEAVKSVKTFKYKGLLSHITDVVILEELLFLATHTDVRLDISSETKKRFNKDDVINSIKAHVKHCKDSSEDNVIRFFIDHKELIETKFSQFAFASG